MGKQAITTLVDFGLACAEQEPERAKQYFELALAERPDDAAAHYGLGRVKILLGEGTADEHFRTAMQSREWRAYARLGLGDALLTMGRRDEALTEYRKLPAVLRDTPEAALRMAACGLAVGELRYAIRVLRRQFERDPGNEYAAALLARSYAVIGRFSDARELAEAVLSRHPDFPEALKAACMAVSGVGDVQATILYSRRLMERQETPLHASHYLYHLLFSSMAAADIDAEYCRLQPVYVRGPVVRECHPVVERQGGRIRIGYVSALFGVHAEHFEPIFRHHDKSRYEVHAFADPGRQCVEGKQRLERHCKAWHECAGMANAELAALVSRTGIDVLVDCDGHFQWGERLGLYAYRPAPIQVSFLYPHRTGSEAIDYQITDARLSPGDHDRSTERLFRLPLFACHEVPTVDVSVNDLPALRNGFVTFGSFSPPLKVNERVIEIWARILKRVPGSRLVLHSKLGPLNGRPYRDIQDRLLGLFGKHGIHRRRLTLAGNRELPAHMAMYHKIDIALDPFPHCGMRTTFMALWMGVPVLTKAGDSMVSRMGASLVGAAGLEGWITQSEDAYVDAACRHAADLGRLADLRRGLRAQVRQSLLMDGEKYTRSLEAAFEHMLDEKRAGEAAKHADLA